MALYFIKSPKNNPIIQRRAGDLSVAFSNIYLNFKNIKIK